MNPKYVIFYKKLPNEEEFHWVFTHPKTFYDSESEAEEIVEQLITEKEIPQNQLKIQKLWIIQIL